MTSTRRRGNDTSGRYTDSALEHDAAWHDLESSLQRLFDAGAQQGRDWKLIEALLITMTEMVSERGEDVLTPVSTEQPERRLRPEFRARIEAVVDSLSDDEAAAFLGAGTRQLRRRAQRGELCFFPVGNRRRYPAWQFDERLGLLPHVNDVIVAIPSTWTPQMTNAFMTTLEAGLKIEGEHITPRTWLAIGLDPVAVVEMIRNDDENDG
ncbi:helix-turn-helix domain-containing protein [Microbacterium sp.]|uniref:helix-turn-helix domain-containing protein n=1 Tax=Microbacterium sp. TaxID=51671 RepID=UPI00356163EA